MGAQRRSWIGRFAGAAATVVIVGAGTIVAAGPALASPAVSAPSSGSSGGHIVVTGSGWPAFDTVYLYLDQGSTQTYFCTGSTDASGHLGPAPCTLPTALPAGTYTLFASDGTVNASQSGFTLLPSAHVDETSSSGPIGSVAEGQTVFLSGGGFAANGTISSVKVGSTIVTTSPATPMVSSQGSLAAVSFVVPAATPAGATTVTVTDSASHSATLVLQVYAATVTAASSAGSGLNLAISGAGWPNDDATYAYLVQGATQYYVCSLSTDASGNLGPQSCVIPTSLPQGSYSLSITDEQVTVTTPFTMNPAAHASETSSSAALGSAAKGQTVYLAGTGFAASTTITSVKLGATLLATTPTAPPVSAQGSFGGATFKIPTSAKVARDAFTVTDSAGHSATFDLSIYSATVTTPSSGVSGRNLAISGAGWPDAETVYAYLDQGSSQYYVCSLATDTAGDLGPEQCQIPTSLADGAYTLSITDQQVTVTKAFTLNPGARASQTASGAAIASVAAGQTVYLAGSGFVSNGTIKSVQVGSSTVATNPAAPILSAQGDFNGVAITIPTATPAGTTTVTVKDSAHHTATFHLAVYAATATAASSGSAGTSLVISGGGWPTNDSVYAYLDQGTTQSYFCSLSTGASGALGSQVCLLPTSLSQGSYTLSLSDQQVTVDSPFTLNPGITLTNTSGQRINTAARGSTVDLAGVGFTASSTITSVKIQSTTVPTSPATPVVTAQGSLSGTSFTVPSGMATGSYTVKVTDSSGHSATAPLTVT